MNSVRKSEPSTELRQGAVEIVRTLRTAGHKAYWAGGCVRDMLLGQKPADYDIATSAHPDQVLGLFPRCVEVGKAFGVIQVLTENSQYDVATFRAEGSYSDGRRPDDVSWADPREDVIRRDFSINGLLYDPLEERIIDYVGGEADLQAGIIRAIGNPKERFEEDALRILRALRFSARLDFEIAPETWQALEQLGSSIARISAERIRYEMERILKEGGGFEGLRMLRMLGLWSILLPELKDPDAAIERFRSRRPLQPAVAWAALWVDQDLSDLELRALGQRMRLSRHLIDKILGIIRCARALFAYETLQVWERKKLVRDDCFDDANLLLFPDESAAHSLAAAEKEKGTWSTIELHPPALLTGDDLARAGYQPGPFFGKVLGEIENRQLAGSMTTRSEALDYVSQQAKKDA